MIASFWDILLTIPSPEQPGRDSNGLVYKIFKKHDKVRAGQMLLETPFVQSALGRPILELWRSSLDMSCIQVLCGPISKGERPTRRDGAHRSL